MQDAQSPDPASRPVDAVVVAFIAFFTLVDLFATQAILPLLAHAYSASPSVIGVAVNASTLGMAIGAFATAVFGRNLDRRQGIMLSLALLAIPTTMLAFAPNLGLFAALRVCQGLCMATAFTLTLAYLGDVTPKEAQAARFAAYISGNVASNLVGRLIAASAANALGLKWNFFLFAGLNLVGALLARRTIRCNRPAGNAHETLSAHLATIGVVLSNASIRNGLGVGFCILLAFIGVFTYVNFVLMTPMFGLSMMALGSVYFVFLPSLITTPLAGPLSVRLGHRKALWIGLGVAILGVLLLAMPSLIAVVAGLVLVGVGTFAAQAAATSFVSQTAAPATRSVASGLYLAAYFSGGLAGAAVVGRVFEAFGWAGCLVVIALSLLTAAGLGMGFKAPKAAEGYMDPSTVAKPTTQ